MSLSEELDLQRLLNLDFDPLALQEKYRYERDRRLRPEGNKQYIKIESEGEYSNFLEDHYVEERAERDAEDLDLDVVVIGGGFGGLQTGAWLRTEGVDEFRIVERAADFGGNWYWSRYPGAACDSEAYCYLPLLEETGYVPTSQYPNAGEIQDHAVRIGRHYDLYKDALFQTNVTSMVWNEDSSRWILGTDRGDELRARFVVLAAGETHAGFKLPGTPGITSFKGKSMHTFRWDYGYTGGSVHGNLDKLKDKRVAIIGVGCSSVQIVPHLGESAEQLYVFQRTPAFVDPRHDQPTDPEWVKSLTPGWQQRRAEVIMSARSDSTPIRDNGAGDQRAAIQAIADRTREAAEAAGVELSAREISELANMQFMERVRADVEATVKDPATAEALKPYYASWCKRPAWSDTYYETFNRSNVTLVDCPDGVERITEKGLVANGVEYEVDLIIYGSGLEVAHSSLFKLTRFPVVGRGGVTLEEHWADGFRTLHGIMVHNLPNYFQMSVFGNGMGVNYLWGNGKQARHIAKTVRRCLDSDYLAIEATVEAEDEWRKALDDSHGDEHNPVYANLLRNLAECTPGYYNNDGNGDDRKGIWRNFYGFGILAYIETLEAWLEGEMPGVEITRGSEAVPVA
jgi:cyclohexanone monooxygenase